MLKSLLFKKSGAKIEKEFSRDGMIFRLTAANPPFFDLRPLLS